MGIRDAVASLVGITPGPNQSIDFLGPTFRSMILGLTPEELYRTQPHLRIVLSFVARNVAHLGLHAFERVGDNDRRRLRTGPLAALLKRPNANMTGYELLEALVSDLGLYDIAYWFFYEDADAPAGWSVRPIPASWVVEQKGGSFFQASSYIIQNPDTTRTEIPAESMLVFHGWNPGRPKHGASPIDTLKQILAEQVQAWSYREQLWQRGGRVGAYLTRPAGGNAWSDTARENFAKEWKKRWTGMDGAKAGGTPILEEGMELKRLGFAAREEEWVEVSKLSLATIAGVFHVNPVMVGILDNANFSNTKEFRKMLYSETLGPTLAMIEDRVNTFLVPKIVGESPVYVEFNIAEKLQGDFEEQATVLSQSAGAPWMTRNEVRAKQNLPALEGGDELVIPLNVLVGGQASPQDSGSQNVGPKDLGELPQIKGAPRRIKARRNPNHVAKAEEVLRAFFKRQRAVVLTRLGAKAPEWWDEERWNRELTDDLYALSATVSLAVAKTVLVSAGLDPDQYNPEQTYAFLRAVAGKRADAVNGTTRDQISAILDGDGPEDADGPAHVFDLAEGTRSSTAALTLVTTLTSFSTVEVGRQNGGAEKEWIVTSSNPRASHAALNGETAPIDGVFSNGAKWPGDSSALDVDEVAGCTCESAITFTT